MARRIKYHATWYTNASYPQSKYYFTSLRMAISCMSSILKGNLCRGESGAYEITDADSEHTVHKVYLKRSSSRR
jgi:hypothetical protein